MTLTVSVTEFYHKRKKIGYDIVGKIVSKGGFFFSFHLFFGHAKKKKPNMQVDRQKNTLRRETWQGRKSSPGDQISQEQCDESLERRAASPLNQEQHQIK